MTESHRTERIARYDLQSEFGSSQATPPLDAETIHEMPQPRTPAAALRAGSAKKRAIFGRAINFERATAASSLVYVCECES
jgi:hypothetical protein